MPIIAPRYQPDGVRIGSQPTPQVRPDMSSARAVQAVGDTIASLGESFQHARNVGEQRVRAQNVADETAGEYAFQKYKQDIDREYAKFSVEAVGDKIASSREAFDNKIKDNSHSNYTADMTPGATQAFSRRAELYIGDRQIAADTVAHTRFKAFTVRVAGQEVNESIELAAMNLAGGKQEAAATQMGRAGAAASRIFDASGEDISQEIVPKSYYGALGILVKEDPLKSLYFYQENKDSFGKYSGDAQKVVAAAADTVSVSVYTEIASRGRDSSGNLNPTAMQDNIKAAENNPNDWVDPKLAPILSLDDQRRDRIESNMRQLLAADQAQRASIGHNLMAQVDALYLQPGGEGLANAFVASSGDSINRMLPEDVVKLKAKMNAGPTVTDQSQLVAVENWFDVAETKEEYDNAMARSASFVISVADRKRLAERYRKDVSAIGSEIDSVSKYTKTLWEETYKRNIPSFRDASAKDQLSESENADIQSYKNHAAKVIEILRGSDGKGVKSASPEDIRKAFQKAAAQIDISVDAERVTLPFADATAADIATGLKNDKQERRKIALDIMARKARLGTRFENQDPGEESTLSNMVEYMRTNTIYGHVTDTYRDLFK